MKRTYCVICDSHNYVGAFSTKINDKPVMVCRRCSDAIRGVAEANIRDTRYDEFMGSLFGRREIVINSSDGGYDLSHHAQIEYCNRLGIKHQVVPRYDRHANEQFGPFVLVNQDRAWFQEIPRDDPVLVKVVRDLGDKANGYRSILNIVSIPADVEWQLESYLGEEWVAEKHRIWF